jgi:hypothetical protein
VLERLIYNQLECYLTKNKLIFDYQFGFRKGYSIEQAILEITDRLKSEIDNKKITCGLFLDFSKACDRAIIKFCWRNHINMAYVVPL